MKEKKLSLYRGHNSLATNILNESQYPIDGIWYSIGLTATKTGYSNFREGIQSDHRVLWVECLIEDVFKTEDKIAERVAVLKASDSRDVKKYIYRTK